MIGGWPASDVCYANYREDGSEGTRERGSERPMLVIKVTLSE